MPSTASTMTTRGCGCDATMRSMVCRGLSQSVRKADAEPRAGVCAMRSGIALVNQRNLAWQGDCRKRQSKRPLDSCFAHDLRANAFGVCREGKPLHTFPDHAREAACPVETANAHSTRATTASLRMP